MPKFIKDGTIAVDRWTPLPDACSAIDLPERAPVIVPLALWLAERDALRARGNVGVRLAPDDDPAALAEDVAALPLIAIEFPQFTDGRGYSSARLLRERYRFRGELRAIGDVLRDQLYLLAECGFDAFTVREDRDPRDALRSLQDFAGLYAATARTPQPWFRRRQTTLSADVWYPDP